VGSKLIPPRAADVVGAVGRSDAFGKSKRRGKAIRDMFGTAGAVEVE
jgi:hypothetical protein